MKTYKLILFLVACFLGSGTAWAQTGGVSGHVTDGKEHIGYATVRIAGSAKGTAADASGHFSLKNLPLGTIELEVGAVGFKKSTIKVIVRAGKMTDVEVVLQEDVLGLEQIVVTANRNSLSRKESAVIVGVTDGKVLASVQALTLADGLGYQPGLRVENNCQSCGFTQIRMNGLDGAYTRILIDGQPMFSALNGVYGLEQIPEAMIERIETVRGGGSALYGAGAVAGTINIITKDPINNFWQIGTNTALIDGKTPDFAADVSGGVSSEDMRSGLTFFGALRSREPFDANDDGFSEMTLLRNLAFGLKGFYKPMKNSRLSLEFHSLSEFRRGGNLFDRPAHLTDITEQLDHRVMGGQLAYEHFSADLKNKFTARFSAQTTERGSYYGGGGNSENPEDLAAAATYYGNTDDLSLAGGLMWYRETGEVAGNESALTLGTEFSYNKVSDRMPGYRREIRQKVGNAGFYGQWEFRPLAKLKAQIGGRFDRITLDGSYQNGEFNRLNNQLIFNVFNPRLNILWDLDKRSQVRAGYASGFRAPQAFDEDLHIETLNGAAKFIRPADDLTHESSESWTLSADRTFSRKSTEVYFLLESFYTRLDNPFVNELTGEILPESGAALAVKRNGESAEVYGFNGELKANFGANTQIQAGFTAQRALYRAEELLMQDAEGRQIRSSRILRSPDFYGYALWQQNLGEKWVTALSGIFTGPMSVPNQNKLVLVRTPSFMELNLKISRKIKLPGGLSGEIQGGVQNMFNSYQSDLETGAGRDPSYIYGPSRPRTLFFGLRLGRD